MLPVGYPAKKSRPKAVKLKKKMIYYDYFSKGGFRTEMTQEILPGEPGSGLRTTAGRVRTGGKEQLLFFTCGDQAAQRLFDQAFVLIGECL
jgi:hypothetical protein